MIDNPDYTESPRAQFKREGVGTLKAFGIALEAVAPGVRVLRLKKPSLASARVIVQDELWAGVYTPVMFERGGRSHDHPDQQTRS